MITVHTPARKRGRPATEPTHSVSIRMTAAQRNFCIAMGGAVWIKKYVNAQMAKQAKALRA